MLVFDHLHMWRISLFAYIHCNSDKAEEHLILPMSSGQEDEEPHPAGILKNMAYNSQKLVNKKQKKCLLLA